MSIISAHVLTHLREVSIHFLGEGLGPLPSMQTEVCQSETLWRIKSSSGAYGIASGAGKKKKRHEWHITLMNS